MRENLIEQTLRDRPRDERLGEPREVLDQDVPVGEQAHQDELDLRALADHGALDLVEDLGRAGLHLASARSPPRSPPASRRSRAARPCCSHRGRTAPAGASRSGRTSSHVCAPSSARARSGWRSSETPWRASRAAAISRTIGRRTLWRSNEDASARSSARAIGFELTDPLRPGRPLERRGLGSRERHRDAGAGRPRAPGRPPRRDRSRR